MTDNIVEKIQKLLALSQSSNEHEAYAALTKAKELMAKHKLENIELDMDSKEIIRLYTGTTFTSKVDPWISILAELIASNHCCKVTLSHYSGGKRREILINGFREDAENCREIFYYALMTIYSRINQIRKQYKEFGYTTSELRPRTNSFAMGFISGLEEAYIAQISSEESTWGLVMQIPKEVEDSVANLSILSVQTIYSKALGEYSDGYARGKKFLDKSPDLLQSSSNKSIMLD